VDQSLRALAEGERRRAARLAAGRWREHGEAVRAAVRRAHGPMPFGAAGGPLCTRLVSAFDTRHCRVENVLFDSFPGWEVNASVFVPRGRGPFPAVVIPVGHSGKQFESYQVPAQAFASLGYLAVLFDPPGQSSERRTGNDHFHEGVRCHLTGLSSSRYFVLDALRCIDYLETRPDADLRRGVAMTGVSGGGATTILAALFDGRRGDGAGRISCQGPSCCLARMADHPVGDAYAECPETLWPGRVGEGIDHVDALLGAIPVPTLVMAGAQDEVFHIEWARALAGVAAAAWRGAGAAERFAFLEDPGGHAYSLRQVEAFAAFANRWMLGLPEPDAAAPRLDAADFPLLDYEMLRCRPSEAVTMLTLNRDAARGMGAARDPAPPLAEARARVRSLVGGGARGPSAWEESAPFLLWTQEYREAMCTADGLEMPVSLLTPASPLTASRWVVFIDEAGRRGALEAGGPASALARLYDRDPSIPRPSLAVADLPGWGESEPALVPFAAAGWGSRDRFLAYLSASLGDPILAIQVRAALALVEEVAGRARDAGGVALVGRGLGGAVALLAAALSDKVSVVVSWSGLASFGLLAEAGEYAWPAAAFLPRVLAAIDLPEVAAALAAAGRGVLILDPLDAMRRPLPQPRVLYNAAAPGLQILGAITAEEEARVVERLLY
jgi:cephalosporin-C deacetylase-like acetyl esterase